jgi:hypothetical protein
MMLLYCKDVLKVVSVQSRDLVKYAKCHHVLVCRHLERCWNGRRQQYLISSTPFKLSLMWGRRKVMLPS